MTFNPMMLPALPPTSAAGFNAAVDTGPAALSSTRHGQSTKDGRSFLDTLNDVSIGQERSPHTSACSTIRAEVSAVSAKVPPNTAKTDNTVADSSNFADQTGAAAPISVSPLFDLSQAFGKIHLRLFGFLKAGHGSFASANQSEIQDTSGLIFPHQLMGYVQPEGQSALIDWLVGIGPFEQLQADISPEAGNPYLVEQLYAESASNRYSGGMLGSPTEFIGFRHWGASSPEFALDNPGVSAWVNRDTLLAALLQMLQTGAAASGLNAESASKTMIPSLPGAADLSANAKLAENANIANAGKDAPMTLWVTGDPKSQTFLETPSRQITENSPFFKMTADIKAAAEPAANPNFVAEAAPGKPADEGFSLKDPVLKAENMPIAELGGKTAPAEGETKDSGFMFAQDQMASHLKAPESATHSLEGAQRGLNPQAMDQIVHKAVLLLNNDQHEVRLELKPEFLGHIRMQIVTENQQVAIKIVAEFPFVKDMLENNMHQLKALLQAQGLDIEELEVSVAHDSHAEGNSPQAAELAKFQAIRNRADFDDGSAEEPNQPESLRSNVWAETAIDFFA